MGWDNIITFPEPASLFPKRRVIPVSSEPQEEAPSTVHWRTREHIRDDIAEHEAARGWAAKS
jgi:hypothetical protein